MGSSPCPHLLGLPRQAAKTIHPMEYYAVQYNQLLLHLSYIYLNHPLVLTRLTGEQVVLLQSQALKNYI